MVPSKHNTAVDMHQVIKKRGVLNRLAVIGRLVATPSYRQAERLIDRPDRQPYSERNEGRLTTTATETSRASACSS